MQVEQDVTKEMAMDGILLCWEMSGIELLAFGIEGLLVIPERCSISDEDLITSLEFSIEDKDHILTACPLILLHQLQLPVLPLQQLRIVLSLHVLAVPVDLYQMLDLIHEASYIVTLRDIHAETKNTHFLLRSHSDGLLGAEVPVDGDLHLPLLLSTHREMDTGTVFLVIDQLEIVIFNSHVRNPISCMIPVSTVLDIYLLELHLLLPPLSKQLILDLCLKIKGAILNLLMDVCISIVTDHVRIETVICVLVPQSGLGEVLLRL